MLLSRAKRLSPAPVSFLRLRLHLFLASCFIYLQFLVPRKIFLNHSDSPYLLILGYDLRLGLYYLAAFPGTSWERRMVSSRNTIKQFIFLVLATERLVIVRVVCLFFCGYCRHRLWRAAAFVSSPLHLLLVTSTSDLPMRKLTVKFCSLRRR